MPSLRKLFLAAAAASIFAAPSFAAQVELWGIVDTSIDVANNGDKTVTKLSSGNREASRFGFRGTEKLADGVEVFFRLEATTFVDNGQMSAETNRLFDREAALGIRSDKYGTLTFGRLYSPHFITMAASDPADMSIGSAGGYFGSPANEATINGRGADEVTRGNNAIEYVTPDFHGFSMKFYTALGEKTKPEGYGSNSPTRGNMYSIGMNYRGERLTINASWLRQNTENSAFNEWDDYYALGILYDFGITKPALLVVHRKGSDTAEANLNGNGETGNGSPDLWMVQLGATTPLYGGKLLTQVAGLKNETREDADAWSWSIRYDYPLSKTFTLYGGVTGLINDTNSRYNIGGGGSASPGLEVDWGNNTWMAYTGMTLHF